ncbi:D-tyrosyl-tRNA(Tyr) deacylase [Pedobacter antarcticus 4BY]|uniref:D-aminoacyl-tRNA deacylase n=2 Tax=Pedobacter antarcticus TaxID=34086 RepID=A0A081PGR0_9SPHI|nr:D-aminoacyl-tRNA deacylase [Pedobacter antarcticus]KEQ29883.1 D-tyrosyl-tRNA(Tyr) deacylase [Pedobacter antarcticus 4BY]SFF14788.1 D-tyrosyl-tRNA(Tyr) deacylase [Pedobacter antarcticus]
MRAVIQRVKRASCHVEEKLTGEIKDGLLVLLGIEDADEQEDLEWLAAKICNLRIFGDDAGLMNKSLLDLGGEILLISQFTLFAATKKGNRPGFTRAARPEKAIPLYEQMQQQLARLLGKPVATGIFGADMQISLVNDGPVTITIDTKKKE